MTPEEIIAIVQAFREGKKLQSRSAWCSQAPWLDYVGSCGPKEFHNTEWRVKDEFLEWWGKQVDGLARAGLAKAHEILPSPTMARTIWDAAIESTKTK